MPLSHILRLSAAGALLDIHSTQPPLLQPHRSKPQICYNPPTNARLKDLMCELQGNEVDARMFEASGYAFSSAGGDAHSNGLLFTSPCGDIVTVNTSNWRHTSHLTSHTSHLQVLKRWDFDHKLQLMSVAVSPPYFCCGCYMFL